MTTAKFINYRYHTDVRPYEVLEMNEKGNRAKVRSMKAERDPTWTSQVEVGGFAGHCTNQETQRWTCTPDADAPVETMTLRKNGRWQFQGQATERSGCSGSLQDAPRYFQDYNF